VLYHLSFVICFNMVVMNLFVMVICDAFALLHSPYKDELEVQIPSYMEAWSDLDITGRGALPEEDSTGHNNDVYQLMVRVPHPIGVGHNDHHKVAQKVEFLKRNCKRDKDGMFSFHNILVCICKDFIANHGKAESERPASPKPSLEEAPVAKAEAVETAAAVVEMTPRSDPVSKLSLEQESMIATLVESASQGDANAAAKVEAIRRILSSSDVGEGEKQSMGMEMFYDIFTPTGAPDVGDTAE